MTKDEFKELDDTIDRIMCEPSFEFIEHSVILKSAVEFSKLMHGTHPDFTLCVRKEHTPTHDGDTGYYYYEPVSVLKKECV